MAITTYTELKATIADWLNRADLDQQIPDFITLAESTLNSVLRSTHMAEQATVAITSGRGTLPSDCLELMYVQVEGEEAEPLEQVTHQQLMMLRRSRTKQAGNPRFFAVVGREILVTPTPSSSLNVVVDYYEKIPALSGSVATNWLLEEAPHMYLYTSLLHASPFLMDDARYAVFTNTVSSNVMNAVKQSQALSFDDIKTAGFSLRSPSDASAPDKAPNPSAQTGVTGLA
jgi:hypothetical protein